MNYFVYAGSVENPLSAEGARGFLEGVLGGVMYMALPVVGVILVYIGFLFVSARGNREQISTATRYFGVAIVGIILVFGAYMFGNVAYNTLIKGVLGW